MAQKYSTCLVNLLVGGRSLRSILDNCVLKIYTGAAPADADAAETGTVLSIVSLSSAWNGTAAAGTAGVAPTVDEWLLTLPATIPTGPTVGKTIKVALQIDAVNGTYTYTVTGADGGTAGAAAFLDRVANMINQAQRPVRAIGFSGAAENGIMITPIVRGVTLTPADGAGDDLVTVAQKLVATRPNTLQFGPPTLGVISKLAGDTWTGINLATGVAGYFRLVLPSDTGLQDASLAMPRVQGSVGTSGADMNLDSVQFVISATTTISAFSIQEPTSA